MQTLPWIVVLALLALAFAALVYWALMPRRKPTVPPLPTEWALTARPVFSTDERRVYRLLREALPHHVILAKLPLVRLCQPTDLNEVHYWYDLLGAHHVAFAVCSANGRVLAAIDLETDRASSHRVLQIKQSVLASCRVRYLRCPPDRLPTIAELQLLVPQNGATPRGPQPAPAPAENLHQARDTLSSTVATRRAERTALWQDSTFFQDSFFAMDSRLDGGNTDFGSLGSPVDPERDASALDGAAPREPHAVPTGDDDDIVGIVVDTPRYPTSTRH